MPDYDLAPAAEGGLIDVARYTLRTWGIHQARRYEALLIACFEEIARGRVPSRELLISRPEIRFVRCEQQYVFFTMQRGAPVLILAVLHERMNLLVRLKERLE